MEKLLTPGPIERLLAADHRRLDQLLQQAVIVAERIDPAAFDEFRRLLLRHISMEEKVLLPTAQRLRGQPLPLANRLKLEHGALAALLVPPPNEAIVAALVYVLARHNPLEEGPDGVYHQCEMAAGEQLAELVEKLNAVPNVPVSDYSSAPNAIPAARRALSRAGYDNLLPQ